MIDLTIIGTVILDFQTVDFEPDSKIAVDLLVGWQKTTQMENAFALDPPVQSAGWSHYKGLWITANRRMSKGSIRAGVRSVAMRAAICSPETGPALKPYVPQPM